VALFKAWGFPDHVYETAFSIHFYFNFSSSKTWWTGGESNPQTMFRRHNRTSVLRPIPSFSQWEITRSATSLKSHKKLTKILLKIYNFLKDWVESTGRGIGYTPKLMTPTTAILLFFNLEIFSYKKATFKVAFLLSSRLPEDKPAMLILYQIYLFFASVI